MPTSHRNRREFLKEGAMLAGLAAVGGARPAGGTKGEQKLSANGGPVASFLVGEQGKLEGIRRWPFATTVWDYINKAIPFKQEGSLSADEVYAVTAYLLYRNGIIKQDELCIGATTASRQSWCSGNSINTSAGVITGTSTSSRQIQFGMKLIF